MGIIEDLIAKFGTQAAGSAATAGAGAGAGATAAGIGAGQDAAAEALKAGGGLSFGSASVPGIAQGEDLAKKRLSEAMTSGFKGAGQALTVIAPLLPGKGGDIANISAAAFGAAGASDDPQKALAAMQAPLAEITKSAAEERAAKDKRLKEALQPNQSLLDRQRAATAQAPPPRPPTAAGPPPATSLLPPGGGGQNLPNPNDRLSTFNDSLDEQDALIQRIRGF